MANTVYGDISPRTAAKAMFPLLDRAIPYLVIEQFGQGKPLPKNSSKTAKFRRYDRLPITPKSLTEGVTPAATQLTKTDYTATLVQYGDRVEITDVIDDTHEDPVLQESMELLGEQASQMVEKVRFGVINAGTSVIYANGVVSRATVASKVLKSDFRKAVKLLKREDAKKITKVIRSTPNYETANVNGSFIGLFHPDLEGDIRDLDNFVPVEKYGTLPPYEGEIGKVDEVRLVCSTIFESWIDAGATTGAGTTYESDGGTNCDVYPILVIGQNAYGIVPLRGKEAITPMVVNPKPSDSDPMAQRGHVAWKTYQTAIILNESWMVRIECCASI